MDDFDVSASSKQALADLVHRISKSKHFFLNLKSCYRSTTFTIKYRCVHSPYLEDQQSGKSLTCPFYVAYKFNEDDEEFYLDSYDEMHNHLMIPTDYKFNSV